MSAAPIPANENERLAALARTGIVDTPREDLFDQIVKEASEAADAPMAVISFITQDRQWFKASVGVDVDETDRSSAFCAWAIHSADVTWVEDAVKDERFNDNPLVLGDPNIRHYAGAPISTPDGYLLGTLCVIDNKPKAFDQTLTPVLQSLAKRVSEALSERTPPAAA